MFRFDPLFALFTMSAIALSACGSAPSLSPARAPVSLSQVGLPGSGEATIDLSVLTPQSIATTADGASATITVPPESSKTGTLHVVLTDAFQPSSARRRFAESLPNRVLGAPLNEKPAALLTITNSSAADWSGRQPEKTLGATPAFTFTFANGKATNPCGDPGQCGFLGLSALDAAGSPVVLTVGGGATLPGSTASFSPAVVTPSYTMPHGSQLLVALYTFDKVNSLCQNFSSVAFPIRFISSTDAPQTEQFSCSLDPSPLYSVASVSPQGIVAVSPASTTTGTFTLTPLQSGSATLTVVDSNGLTGLMYVSVGSGSGKQGARVRRNP